MTEFVRDGPGIEAPDPKTFNVLRGGE